MSGQKVKTVVKIAGRDYSISGVESEEYMHRIAIFVDRKIQELVKACPQLSTSDAAVLAAVNMADELLKLKEDYMALDERINLLRELPRGAQRPLTPQRRPFEPTKTNTTMKSN